MKTKLHHVLLLVLLFFPLSAIPQTVSDRVIEQKFKNVDQEIAHLKELFLRSEISNSEKLRLAKESTDGRLEKLNELREEFTRQQGSLATKALVETVKEGLTERIVAGEVLDSSKAGSLKVFVAIGAFISGIMGGVITFVIINFLKKQPVK